MNVQIERKRRQTDNANQIVKVLKADTFECLTRPSIVSVSAPPASVCACVSRYHFQRTSSASQSRATKTKQQEKRTYADSCMRAFLFRNLQIFQVGKCRQGILNLNKKQRIYNRLQQTMINISSVFTRCLYKFVTTLNI